jgi:hypothetical protein
MQANSYATVLAQSSSPLDDVQLSTLVTALLEEQKSMQLDTVALARQVDPANPQSQRQASDALQTRKAESSQRVLAAASSRLTEQQLSVLRTLLEQQDAVKRAADVAADRSP